MTPQEKAVELYSKVYGQTPTRMDELQIEEDKRFSKECALICVDEILLAITYAEYGLDYLNQRDYWQQVKEEIEKL